MTKKEASLTTRGTGYSLETLQSGLPLSRDPPVMTSPLELLQVHQETAGAGTSFEIEMPHVGL